MSPRSERRFRRARGLAGPIFRLIDVLAVQEPDDVARWESLGVDRTRIQVTGNTKFDYAGGGGGRAAEFRALLRQRGVADDAPVLLAGSTFPGEELILARLYRELRKRFPNLFLILVPRPCRADARSAGRSAPIGPPRSAAQRGSIGACRRARRQYHR
ncbi:MAG: glycosyltransferase N-terminal domain-containing protein [Chthoniobacter sp.]